MLSALIKLLLRLRSHARIGVRAAGNKTNEQIRKRKRSRETSTPTNKSYDLTSHLYRPPYLTSYIGVRPHRSQQNDLCLSKRGIVDTAHPQDSRRLPHADSQKSPPS